MSSCGARPRRRRAGSEEVADLVWEEDPPEPTPAAPSQHDEDEGGRQLHPWSPAGDTTAPWPNGS